MNDKRQIIGRTFDAGFKRFIDDTAKGKTLEALRALFGCASDITATDITATATLQPPRSAPATEVNIDHARTKKNSENRIMYHRTVKLSFKSFMLALLAVMLMAVAVSAQTTSPTAAFDVHVRGHLTRPQMFCPSGATLCGTAYIEGYGNAEYGWFLSDISGPSASCGPHSGLFDYRSLVRFTLPDGSTLTLQEVGTLCSAGNSYPTGGLNSYGNPLFFDAYWQVVSATGQFAGLIGNGTSRGTFAGAAVDIRYGGTLNVGSNEATIRLSWDILRNGALATCEEVSASHVRLKLLGIGSTMETEFDCNQKLGEVITNAGTYTFEIELVDSAGTSLSLVPIVYPVELFIGDVFDLGYYQFSFAF